MGCRQAVRHQTLTLAFVGSNPAIPANDPLAQLAEQLPFKQWVRSSNLRRVTKKSRYQMVSALFASAEIRRSKMQYAGGILLPPVQTLVATLIFACGCRQKCNESPAGSDATVVNGGAPRRSPPTIRLEKRFKRQRKCLLSWLVPRDCHISASLAMTYYFAIKEQIPIRVSALFKYFFAF